MQIARVVAFASQRDEINLVRICMGGLYGRLGGDLYGRFVWEAPVLFSMGGWGRGGSDLYTAV